ncbi:hypothetical protein ACFPVY_02735 [Flavobacterium qiangtangense]|uniref:Uncharacterized protein n=1 Tax=Flavobacterium qiangtangense TaxID=1442595 RepID=A0ABW1PK08_9FLAO
MTIYINCTNDDLKAKTVRLQDALSHENIDRHYWLEALSPGGKGSDPYEGLPKEDCNAKFTEWMDFYDEYAKLRRY